MSSPCASWDTHLELCKQFEAKCENMIQQNGVSLDKWDCAVSSDLVAEMYTIYGDNCRSFTPNGHAAEVAAQTLKLRDGKSLRDFLTMLFHNVVSYNSMVGFTQIHGPLAASFNDTVP